MTLPPDIGTDAKAIAEWFVWNHTGELCGSHNETLINDLAGVLAEFRGQPSGGMTPQQAVAFNFIKGFIADNGFAPNYSEIAKGIGLASKSQTHALVKQLEHRGFILSLPHRARSIQVLGRA